LTFSLLKKGRLFCFVSLSYTCSISVWVVTDGSTRGLESQREGGKVGDVMSKGVEIELFIYDVTFEALMSGLRLKDTKDAYMSIRIAFFSSLFFHYII